MNKRSVAFSKIKFIEGLSFGVFLSTTLFGGILLMFEATRNDIDNYLTMIVPFVGVIISGWLTVSAIRSQVQKQLESEEAKNFANFKAARSLLPFALAERSERAEEIISHISDPTKKFKEDWGAFHNSNDALLKCITYADATTSQNLADLLAIEQIIIARTKGAIQEIPRAGATHDIDHFSVGQLLQFRSNLLFYWWTYFHFISRSFDFARGREDVYRIPEIDFDDARGHLLYQEATIALDRQPNTLKRFDEYAELHLDDHRRLSADAFAIR